MVHPFSFRFALKYNNISVHQIMPFVSGNYHRFHIFPGYNIIIERNEIHTGLGTEESGDFMAKLNVYKKSLGFLTAAFTFAAVATGCAGSDQSSSESASKSKTTGTSVTESTLSASPMSNKDITYSELFSERDLSGSYDSIDAEIKLSGDSIDCDGSGVSVEGSSVTITEKGVYRITGTLDEGQIVVDAKGEKVQLVLDGASITSKSNAPISVVNADKVFITLAEGSENTVTDNRKTSSDEEQDSAIFSKDSLTINGSGSLTVNSSDMDGIRSKDDIVITGGKITVKSGNNGIKAKDYIAAVGCDIKVDAGNDGLKASNTEDASLGFIYIESGDYDITAIGDGISAETVFYAESGDFNIVSGGGSTNSTKTHTDDFGGFGGGRDFGGIEMPTDENGEFTMPEGMIPPDDFDPSEFGGRSFGGKQRSDAQSGATPETNASDGNAKVLANIRFSDDTDDDVTSSTISQKGIKGSEIIIKNGDFTIDSSDDAIHSNGNVDISGGNITVSAGDDGLHADEQIDISAGTYIVSKSYEGIEGKEINISGGTVEVTASDDGFNGSDGTSQGGMATYSESVVVNISGGTVYVNADGDGLDSNGDMNISGGTVIVNGSTNGGNGALDSNGEITVTGGTVIAAGNSAMAEAPSEKSEQNSVSATFDSNFKGGTLVTLTDSDGKELLSFAPAKSFNNIVISTPDLVKGETYKFYTNGTSSAEQNYGLYKTGGYKGDGDESGSFTVESAVSYVGERSGFGGGKNFGGREMPTGENGEFTMPDGMTPPNGKELPTDENGKFTMPEGMTPPNGMTPPDGFNGGRGGRRSANNN